MIKGQEGDAIFNNILSVNEQKANDFVVNPQPSKLEKVQEEIDSETEDNENTL